MTRNTVISATVLGLAVVSILSAGILLSPASAQTAATQQRATFAIENMTCALCPVTVKSAIARVNGVQSVQIDFGAKTATVVFDPSVTSIQAIAAASTNAGYPATAKS